MEEKKGIGALILAMGKPKKSESAEDEMSEVDDHAEGEKSVMGEFIDSVKSGDVDGALESFKSLLEVCEK